jgi:hypothetical protein
LLCPLILNWEAGMVMLLRVAAGLARRETGGVWGAVRAYVEWRAARAFERERRATLLMVPQALPPGTLVYDRRADGSVLELRIPESAKIGAKSKETIMTASACGLEAGHPGAGAAGPRQITAARKADWGK